MGLPKGRTNNPKGRPKGKPNIASKDIRESFSMLIRWYIESNLYIKDFSELKPRERLRHIENISNYAVARLQAVDLTNSSEVDKLSDEQLIAVVETMLDKLNKNE